MKPIINHSTHTPVGVNFEAGVASLYNLGLNFGRATFFSSFRATISGGFIPDGWSFSNPITRLAISDFADIELNADKQGLEGEDREDYVRKARARFPFKVSFLLEFPEATREEYFYMLRRLDSTSRVVKTFDEIKVERFLDESEEDVSSERLFLDHSDNIKVFHLL